MHRFGALFAAFFVVAGLPAFAQGTGKGATPAPGTKVQVTGADYRRLFTEHRPAADVAYKPGVADTRESPALKIIAGLLERGAAVSYHDPHVPDLPRAGLHSRPLDAALAAADIAVVVTAHPELDYADIASRVPRLLDLRGVTRGIDAAEVERL